MGTWNDNTLYGNDLALDIKREIKAVMAAKPYAEAIDFLLEYYIDIITSDEANIFWFVWADVLYKHGQLDDEIREYAIRYIDEELEKDELKMVVCKKRLEKMREMLLSPQPLYKKFNLPKPFKSKFKIGDIVAVKMCDETIISQLPQDFQIIKNKYIPIWVVDYNKRFVCKALGDESPYRGYASAMIFNLFGDLDELKTIDFKAQTFLPTDSLWEANDDNHLLYLYGGINYPSRSIKMTKISEMTDIDFDLTMMRETISLLPIESNILKMSGRGVLSIDKNKFILPKDRFAKYNNEYVLKLMGLN
jgi:hypothetical protein